jgi:hypothetical protein
MVAIKTTANDPRHYTSRDGRILPVTGTHVDGEGCGTCNYTPTRPAVNFHIGQRVIFKYGRGRVEGLVSRVGRRYVSVVWTSRSRKRHESNRLASELTPTALVRDARAAAVAVRA